MVEGFPIFQHQLYAMLELFCINHLSERVILFLNLQLGVLLWKCIWFIEMLFPYLWRYLYDYSFLGLVIDFQLLNQTLHFRYKINLLPYIIHVKFISDIDELENSCMNSSNPWSETLTLYFGNLLEEEKIQKEV